MSRTVTVVGSRWARLTSTQKGPLPTFLSVPDEKYEKENPGGNETVGLFFWCWIVIRANLEMTKS